MAQSLLLTLGHNSSAILLDGGEVVCGYSNERISHIKSDSSFPELAIREIQKSYTISQGVDIYVSHWFVDGKLPDDGNKWWSPHVLKDLFKDHTVYSLKEDLTHHDCHARSALMFMGKDYQNHDPKLSNYSILVADGFGTKGEVLSYYDASGVDRLFGFDSSLGMLYQHATAYLGLKMNQDEYKLLGYEAHIKDFIHDLDSFEITLMDFANAVELRMMSPINCNYDPVVSLDALPFTMKRNFRLFDKFVELYKDEIQASHSPNFMKKVLIACMAQYCIEYCIIRLIRRKQPENLAVAGGLFMNVKLNNKISKLINSYGGKLTVMPLSGDDGAAIGLYGHYHGDFKWPGHMFWGDRVNSEPPESLPDRFFIGDEDHMFDEVVLKIKTGHIVNVVSGKMEFGARALGNTSTLCKANRDNVIYINACNDRTTVMPMAGIIREEMVRNIHPDYSCVNKSMQYMSTAMDMHPPSEFPDVQGATHFDPYSGQLTGRTQVVKKDHPSLLHRILTECEGEVGMLINTSFNYHGRPIVLTMSDAISNHVSMIKNDAGQRVHTYFLTKEQ